MDTNNRGLERNRRAILLVAVFTALLTTFTGSALNLSIPSIDNEFHAGAAAIGWVISGYILAAAAMSVPFGRLADLTGRERILKIGILIFSLFRRPLLRKFHRSSSFIPSRSRYRSRHDLFHEPSDSHQRLSS